MIFRKWLTGARQKKIPTSELTASKMAIYVAPKTVLENKCAIQTTFNSTVLDLVIVLRLL